MSMDSNCEPSLICVSDMEDDCPVGMDCTYCGLDDSDDSFLIDGSGESAALVFAIVGAIAGAGIMGLVIKIANRKKHKNDDGRRNNNMSIQGSVPSAIGSHAQAQAPVSSAAAGRVEMIDFRQAQAQTGYAQPPQGYAQGYAQQQSYPVVQSTAASGSFPMATPYSGAMATPVVQQAAPGAMQPVPAAMGIPFNANDGGFGVNSADNLPAHLQQFVVQQPMYQQPVQQERQTYPVQMAMGGVQAGQLVAPRSSLPEVNLAGGGGRFSPREPLPERSFEQRQGVAEMGVLDFRNMEAQQLVDRSKSNQNTATI